MTFHPTADQLMPDLTPAQEIVLLARTLSEGYDDHIAPAKLGFLATAAPRLRLRSQLSLG